MQLFSAVAIMFSFFFFFAHKKLKKPPSKVAHNRPKPFISQSSPAHGPELIFYIIKCREQASVLLYVIRKLLCNRNTHYGHYIYVPWTLDEKLI